MTGNIEAPPPFPPPPDGRYNTLFAADTNLNWLILLPLRDGIPALLGMQRPMPDVCACRCPGGGTQLARISGVAARVALGGQGNWRQCGTLEDD
jgi:hypothetical protein